MGCCASKKDADETPSEAPVRLRKVNNFCWIVLFIAGCVFSGFVTMKAKNDKHFSPIYQNGVDSWGNICGQESQEHEYGHIEKWNGGLLGNQPVGYPVISNINENALSNPKYVLDRKTATKVYNSGFPQHGTNLCLNKCPGAALPSEIYDTTESLQKLGALYMAGSSEGFSEFMFENMVRNSFPDIPLETVKSALWCETVASENGYDRLELCSEQKVMMPSSTILHMCAPHYKIALAVAQASMSAQNELQARNEKNSTKTENASFAEKLSEAGNAVVANKNTIFLCFFGAMIVAALVILIIQIFTKYLIYTVVVAFFVSALTASAFVWYSYLQVANPELLGDIGIPTDLTNVMCNQTERAITEMRNQRMMMNDDLRFITMDSESAVVLETNFERNGRFYQNIHHRDVGSGSNNAISDLADSIDSISDSFTQKQARICNNNGTSGGNTDEQKEEIQQRLYTAIGVSVVCFIIILVICCNCGNIRLAVNLFDEAGTCVFAIPGILFQPIYTMLILGVVLFVCVSQFLFVCQVRVPVVLPDDQENAGQVKWFHKSIMWEYVWVYTFFITVWVGYFIDGCHQVTLAGAVNNWYWSQSESTIVGRCWNRLKCCPGARAFCDLLKFSLGSVALGSMLVAIIQTIRVIIWLVQKAGKRATGNKESKLTKFIFGCIQCMLACVQKFLEFINRNGYIGIAIFGYDFCRAAQKCLALKVENAGRALMLMLICRFVLLLGKICSVVGSCVMCKKLLEADKSSEDMPIHSQAAVYGCVAIFSFWITSVFLSVYDLTLDTIFLCFCEDQQRNNGRDRPYKSSAKLQKFMRENA